jgi:hypothetical protein
MDRSPEVEQLAVAWLAGMKAATMQYEPARGGEGRSDRGRGSLPASRGHQGSWPASAAHRPWAPASCQRR